MPFEDIFVADMVSSDCLSHEIFATQRSVQMLLIVPLQKSPLFPQMFDRAVRHNPGAVLPRVAVGSRASGGQLLLQLRALRQRLGPP